MGIPVQDAIYKIILPVTANGQFAVRVADSKTMLVNIVGTLHQFDQTTLKKYFKGVLLTNIKDYIAAQFVKNRVSFLEIHSHLREISEGIADSLRAEFQQYGITLVNFNVNHITPPENDPSYIQLKKALAKKAEMDVMGYSYQQERTFDILNKAAANQGGASGVMNLGMGLGMGVNVGGAIGGAMRAAVTNIDTRSAGSTIECPNCGSQIPVGSKFCRECGKKIGPEEENKLVKCPVCGAMVPEGKFCLECGAKLQMCCPGCGAKVIPGAKFCLECGAKLS